MGVRRGFHCPLGQVFQLTGQGHVPQPRALLGHPQALLHLLRSQGW